MCKLLRNGLVKGSFVPERDMRELRDLTRYRKKLVQAISSEKNRIQKVLEDANVKLSSVVSDTFGVSGSEIIEALLSSSLPTLYTEYWGVDEISEGQGQTWKFSTFP